MGFLSGWSKYEAVNLIGGYDNYFTLLYGQPCSYWVLELQELDCNRGEGIVGVKCKVHHVVSGSLPLLDHLKVGDSSHPHAAILPLLFSQLDSNNM